MVTADLARLRASGFAERLRVPLTLFAVQGARLLAGRPALDVAVDGILPHEVARVPSPDAGGLHAPVGGQVGGAEGQALHAGAGEADLLDVGDATGGLEDGVDHEGLGEPGLDLELGEQPAGETFCNARQRRR